MSDERESGKSDGNDGRPPVKAPNRLPSGGWSQVPDLPPPPTAARPIREDAAPRVPADAERSLAGDRIVPSEPEIAVDIDPASLRNDADWDADQEAFVKAAFDSRPPTVAVDRRSIDAPSASAGTAEPPVAPRRSMPRPDLPEPKGSTQMGYQARSIADSELPAVQGRDSQSDLVNALDAYVPWDADGAEAAAEPSPLDAVVEPSNDVVELELDVDIVEVDAASAGEANDGPVEAAAEPVAIDAADVELEPLGAEDALPELDEAAFVQDVPDTPIEARPSHAALNPAPPTPEDIEPSGRQTRETGESPAAAILRPSTWFGGRRKRDERAGRVDPARTAARVAATRPADPAAEPGSPAVESPAGDHRSDAGFAPEPTRIGEMPNVESLDAGTARPETSDAAEFDELEVYDPGIELRFDDESPSADVADLSLDPVAAEPAAEEPAARDAVVGARADDAMRSNDDEAAEAATALDAETHEGDASAWTAAGEPEAAASESLEAETIEGDASVWTDDSADAVADDDPGEDFGAQLQRPTSDVTVVPGLTDEAPERADTASGIEDDLAALGEVESSDADVEPVPTESGEVTAPPPEMAARQLAATIESDPLSSLPPGDGAADESAGAVDQVSGDAVEATAPSAPPVAEPAADEDPNAVSYLPEPERRLLTLYQPELAGGPPSGRHNWLTRQDLFETQKRGLTNTRRWEQLAAVTAYAAMHADWSVGPARVALLLDLSRLYRTRLDAPEHAEEALVALTLEQPGHAEAVEWLVERYLARGYAGAAVRLHRDAIQGTWDPDERRRHTVEAARIAMDVLDRPALAADAWEDLWRVGDGGDEAELELTRYLRLVGDHGRLGDFALSRAEGLDGAERRRVLREAAALFAAAGRTDDAIAALRRLLDERPDDPVAMHRLSRLLADAERWDELLSLGGTLDDADPADPMTRERAHRVASALEAAGRLGRAASIWRWLHTTDDGDAVAAERLRANLRAAESWPDLVAVIASAADATAEAEDEIALVSEAAEIAETRLEDPQHALMLIRRRIRLEGTTTEGMQALERVARALGDGDAVREALVAQRDLATSASQRVDVLRRLARHDAEDRGDDDAARDALREVLRLDAGDSAAREQLVAIHERRGDHEALDSALVRQLGVTTDPEARQAIALRAARNVDAALDDADRSVAAWRRVLDGAPTDAEALRTLADHEARRGRSRDARFLLELRIAALYADAAVDAWAELAERHDAAGDTVLAAAALERVVTLDPSRADAWQTLAGTWSKADRPSAARAALEDAVRHASPEHRGDRVRAVLELLPPDARDARWLTLRRLWRLAALTGDERVEFLDPPQSREDDLLAVLAEEVAVAAESDRDAARATLVAALEQRAGDAVRALAVHTVGLFDPARLDAGAETVHRLANEADRVELELAVLDRRAELSPSDEATLALRLEAARHVNERCGSPRRAFARLRALAFAASSPTERLDDLRALADAAGLHSALVETLTELSDRCTDDAQIAAWMDEARRLYAERIEDHGAAFALGCRQLRARDEGATGSALLDAARPLHLEVVALAIAEAVDGQAGAPRDALADTWRRVGEPHRGFELDAMAFFDAPHDDARRARLVDAAGHADAWGRLADALRHGAALAESDEVSLGLLDQTAGVLVERLDDHAGAVAIHRQLLALHPDAARSLDVLIEDDRRRERWWDLRDRLSRRASLSDDVDVTTSVLREIAELSEHRLGDDETALRTWRRIVEAHPDDGEARVRLVSILNRVDDPALRLEARRLDAARADGDAAVEILLDIARIERDELDDLDAAIATLEHTIDAHGVDNAASIALVNLYDECGRSADATALLLREADETGSTEARLGYLERVVERAEARPDQLDGEAWERVLATIVELRPDDATARRRLASHLLSQRDLEGWADAIAPLAVVDGDAVGRTWAMLRARVLAHDLDRAEEARPVWSGIGEHPALRSMALIPAANATDDASERERIVSSWAEGLDAPLRALVKCVLAEAAESRGADVSELAALYREARALDPECTPAMEALKGIGRRVRDLRPAAALLPEAGERDMTPAERSARLVERYAEDGDVGWLRRAIASWPDAVDAWERFADHAARVGDRVGAAHARVEGWLARCRTRGPGAGDVVALERAARGLDVAGYGDLADAWLAAAHYLDPARPEAAAVVAERALSIGRPDDARRTVDRALADAGGEIADALRARLHVARGRALRALGDGDSAHADFVAALEVAPTSPDALDALASHCRPARPVEALDLWITALAVEPRPDVRAARLFDVGRGFDDALDDVDEAGPWYVAAHELGLESRDLMHRVFREFQRVGRLDHGLDVVARLLDTATETDELATLWIARGHILADRGGAAAASEAIEAFDMALSYDPGRNDARHGLVRVLEAAEEWDQLAQVLEAIADGSEGHDRARALLRMADVFDRIGGQDERIESLLDRSIDAHPIPEALQRLEAIHADRDPAGDRRIELLGLLVAAGPPWYAPAVELGRLLLDAEPRRAWCLLSPSLMIRSTDDELKGRLRDMRREYERPPLLLARRAPDFDDPSLAAIYAALVAVGDRAVLARPDLGDADPSEVSVHSNIGRTFVAMAARFGIDSVSLYRASIDEPIRVVAGEHVDVVVRADVFQQMARAEIGFVLRYAFAMLEPGARAFFSTDARDRRHLVDAIRGLCGLADITGEQAATYATAIEDAFDDELRAAVAMALEHDERGPGALARDLEASLRRHARRLSLVAGADVYQIARLLARMNDGVDAPGVYAMAEHFDEYLAGAPVLADLVTFAASEAFATAIASADEITP